MVSGFAVGGGAVVTGSASPRDASVVKHDRCPVTCIVAGGAVGGCRNVISGFAVGGRAVMTGSASPGDACVVKNSAGPRASVVA